MGGHQPLQPQVYERMPPQVRELMPGVTGSRREDVYEYSKAPWLKADESMAEWAARSGLPPGGVKPLSPQELGSATEHLARHGYAVLHGRIPARATGNEQAQAPVADQLARRCRELCQQAAAAAAGPAESASYGLLNHDSRCASLALSPLPHIFSDKSEKSLCGAGAGHWPHTQKCCSSRATSLASAAGWWMRSQCSRRRCLRSVALRWLRSHTTRRECSG